MTAPIRAALIGLGNSGGFYHLPHLLDRPDYELVAVATEHGAVDDRVPAGVRRHVGWRGAVQDADAELVVIALPHHLHQPVAAAALAAGKHVLVEKPLVLHAAEADALAATAAEAGLVLATHHQRRFERDFQALQQLVAAGELGVPWRIVVTRSHQGPYVVRAADRPHAGAETAAWAHDRRAGGGIARVVAPHSVDHLLRLAGRDVTHVRARAAVAPGESVESWIAIDVDFVGGITGTVEAFRRSRIAPPRFTVYGDRGTAIATDGTSITVRTDAGERRIEGIEPVTALGGEIYDDLAGAIRRGEPLRVASAHARAVVDVLERADRDLEHRGILSPLPAL